MIENNFVYFLFTIKLFILGSSFLIGPTYVINGIVKMLIGARWQDGVCWE